MNKIDPKVKAAALAAMLEDGASVKEVSKRLAISEATLFKWKKEKLPGKAAKTESTAELKQQVKLAALEALNKFISEVNKL